MPKKDPAALQRKREKKERIKREKDIKASNLMTEQGRATLDLVLDGGKTAQPATNLPKAIKEFDDAIALNAQNAEAYFLRGRCFQEQHDLEKAVGDFAACLTINELHIHALLQQALCFEAVADTQRAIDNYSSIIQIDPRHDAAYNLRGCARLAGRGGLGLKLRHVDFTAVEADFLAAISCNENNYYAYCNLGRLYDEHGKYDKAVANYTKAMHVKDDYNYASYRRGCAALTAVEEALRRAERGIAPDPTTIVVEQSCAAVPFHVAAPRDDSRVKVPKGTPSSSIFVVPPTARGNNNNASFLPALQHHSVIPPPSSASGTRSITSAGSKSSAPSTVAGTISSSNTNSTETNIDKLARLQVEQEIADEKQFTQMKQLLATAVADFSKILAPLVENEDRIKELPCLLHRASCYLLDGDVEKAEEDVNFIRRNLDAYKEWRNNYLENSHGNNNNNASANGLLTSTNNNNASSSGAAAASFTSGSHFNVASTLTSADILRNALSLILSRLDNAKQRRRQGLPTSPFASGATSLVVAVKKFQ
jgi:tetratricopeptide (TPR) repeat protein